MREGVLFEITKEHLETGLRGVPVGYCTTSYVDPTQGISYVNHPIQELAFLDCLEVVYLLYFGKTCSLKSLASFQAEIAKRAPCKKETIEAIEGLPRVGHPMDLFAAALLIAGMYEMGGDYREDCLRVIAKLPTLAAAVINRHAGWGKTPPGDLSKGMIGHFLSMLHVPGPVRSELEEVLRLFAVLHLDHGGGNLSTFVGKAVASSLEPMCGSLAAAMTALAGPRHGRANQESLEFLQAMLHDIQPEITPTSVQRAIRERLAQGKVVQGFGHAVLRVEDPRATVCYDYCQKHFDDHPLVRLALLVRSEGSRVLRENHKITDPHPNIDAITGPMLVAAGFPYPMYYTLLFGMARSIGIAIQIVYERLEAREGKGTPIVRPAYLYRNR